MPGAAGGLWLRRTVVLTISALLTAAVALSGCAAGGPDTVTGSSGSCAAILHLEGRSYAPLRRAMRVPEQGRDLGLATSCSDTVANGTPAPPDRRTAYAVPGVPIGRAILADGEVWVAEVTGKLPRKVAELTRPVDCSVRRPDRISGTLINFPGLGDAHRRNVETPYRLLVALHGNELKVLRLDRYQEVRFALVVTVAIRGRAVIERDGVGDDSGKVLTAQVRCRGARFLADSVAIRR